MTRFKKFPRKSHEGKIVYGDGIVDEIVVLAVSELDNVELYSVNNVKSFERKSIKVNFDKDGIVVDVTIKINFMQSVSDIAFKVQEAVRHNVESMTEYHVKNVNVNVFGISFEEKPTSVLTETDSTEKDKI